MEKLQMFNFENYEVINLDKNGTVIKDLSKVVLPEHIQKKIITIVRRED